MTQRIRILGYQDNKKIVAIKGIRAAFGYSLKRAKEISESLPTEVPLVAVHGQYDEPGAKLSYRRVALVLAEHGVLYERVGWRPSATARGFVSAQIVFLVLADALGLVSSFACTFALGISAGIGVGVQIQTRMGSR
jgi:hypothetical protein